MRLDFEIRCACPSALLLAHGTVSLSEATVFALEGFASRAGGRPIARAEVLAAETLAWIEARFASVSSRRALLDILQQRWPDAVRTLPDPADEAAFAAAVRAVLRRVYQIPPARGEEP